MNQRHRMTLFQIASIFFLSAIFSTAGEPNWNDLLEKAAPGNPALLERISSLMHSSPSPETPPALLVVTYRQQGETLRNIVVQLYPASSGAPPVLNPRGTARGRLGDDLGNSADGFLALLERPAIYLGDEREIRRQRRAFDATSSGDLTLLREQTVEALHMIAVLPDAGNYLPGSLSYRVRSVLLNAELNFGVWKGKIGLITGGADDAEQVGNIVGAWRELAGSLAVTYAGNTSGQKLREALQATKVEILNNQVVATAAIPALTAVRVVKEAAGHGGGCPGGAPCAANKVAVCHKDPRKAGAYFTLCVTPTAVASHLAHGDTCGPCQTVPGKGNNGIGNGIDPQPPGNPPVNDGGGTSPGNPGTGK